MFYTKVSIKFQRNPIIFNVRFFFFKNNFLGIFYCDTYIPNNKNLKDWSAFVINPALSKFMIVKLFWHDIDSWRTFVVNSCYKKFELVTYWIEFFLRHQTRNENIMANRARTYSIWTCRLKMFALIQKRHPCWRFFWNAKTQEKAAATR